MGYVRDFSGIKCGYQSYQAISTHSVMWRDISPPLSVNSVTRRHRQRVGCVHLRPGEHDLAQGSCIELSSKERQVE